MLTSGVLIYFQYNQSQTVKVLSLGSQCNTGAAMCLHEIWGERHLGPVLLLESLEWTVTTRTKLCLTVAIESNIKLDIIWNV